MVTLDSVDLAELVNLPGQVQKIANKSSPETFGHAPQFSRLAQSHAPFLVFYGVLTTTSSHSDAPYLAKFVNIRNSTNYRF